jgi:thioredoxin-related protein
MRYILVTIFLFVFSEGSSQVNFQSLDWQAAKDVAKKENKYLFVDCFTEWCGWCKVMDKQTFTDAEVSKFMNDKMVSIKIDMEKGFGIDLGRKYNITGYPTYLILDARGDLLKVIMGYQEAAPFLAVLKESIDPSLTKPLKGYSQKIPESYPDFLTQMWKDKNDKPTKEEISDYLNKTDHQFSEAYWAVLSRFSGIDEKYFNQLAENRARYRSLFGTEAVNDVLSSQLTPMFFEAVKKKDEALFNRFLDKIKAYDLAPDEQTLLNYRLAYYQRTEEWTKMMVQLEEYIRINGEDDVTLNGYCWDIYEKCDDAAIIARATQIMKSVTDAHPMYAEMDTYAALLFKSKQYDEAEATALKAIAIGKESGSDITGTEELLAKIRAAKGQ